MEETRCQVPTGAPNQALICIEMLLGDLVPSGVTAVTHITLLQCTYLHLTLSTPSDA